MAERAPGGAPPPPLMVQVASAAGWNVTLLSLLGVFQLGFGVMIRRRFGVEGAGLYEVLLGLAAAVMTISSIGMPTALLKFLPEAAQITGRPGLHRLLRDAAVVRLLLLALGLVLLHLCANWVIDRLELGPAGVAWLWLITALTVARAIVDLTIRTLNAFFAQRWSNFVALVQVVLEVGFVGTALWYGHAMHAVLGGLAGAAGLAALLGVIVALRHLRRVPTGPARDPLPPARRWFAGEGGRYFQFSVMTYLFEVSSYFMQAAYMAMMLRIVVSAEAVGLFATALKLAFMTVGLVVAGFRGIYRPLFTRVRLRRDPEQLRRAFTVVAKAQLFLLLPAGLGLMVMAGDYIPLLYGHEFLDAVPLTWVLVAGLYAETAFNLPGIVLSIDERYRSLLWLRAPTLIAAPLCAAAAYWGGILPAAIVLAAARFALALLAYAYTRRVYGFRFPWMFAGRIGSVSALMAIGLLSVRAVWSTSWVEAALLTALGAVLYMVGLRLTGALGSEELDLLRRTALPGRFRLAAWFDPAGAGRRAS